MKTSYKKIQYLKWNYDNNIISKSNNNNGDKVAT